MKDRLNVPSKVLMQAGIRPGDAALDILAQRYCFRTGLLPFTFPPSWSSVRDIKPNGPSKGPFAWHSAVIRVLADALDSKHVSEFSA